MLEMKLIIYGQVQGVGYRYAVLDKAESLQLMLKGHIMNLPNGTVEIIAQGDIEALKDLRRIAVEGSEKSKVRDVEEVIQEIPALSLETFHIAY